MEWRKIETAPKDGTRILITDGEDVGSAFWGKIRPNEETWTDDGEDSAWGGPYPTHWMPLPEMPKYPQED